MYISVYECRHKVCVRNHVAETDEQYSHRVCGAACAAHSHIDCYKGSVVSLCSCHYLVSISPNDFVAHATFGHIFITLKDKPLSVKPWLEIESCLALTKTV